MLPDLPTSTCLPKAGQLLYWPPVLSTHPGHETAGCLLWRRSGLFRSGHSQFQLATDPPSSKAEPISHVCAASVKIYWGKSRKCQRGGDKPGREHHRGQGGKKAKRIETREWGENMVRCVGGAPWLSRHTPKGTVAHRQTTLKQRKWVRRKQQCKKRVRSKKKQRETTTSWSQPSVSPIVSPKGLSVTCGDNKRWGDVSGVQLSLGKGKQSCFNVCLLCFPIPKSAKKYIMAIS